jgi:hypothetical protein
MNERIKLLAEQAGFMDSWFSESGDDCERELKKFAELIVEECLYIVEGEDDGSADTKSVRLVMLRMKKHFGVEE